MSRFQANRIWNPPILPNPQAGGDLWGRSSRPPRPLPTATVWRDRENGKYVHYVVFWDPATGQELARRDRHKGPLTGLACSSDGRTAVTSSMDRTLLVWDLRPPPQALPPGGAAALWEPLAGKGAVAYRAG